MGGKERMIPDDDDDLDDDVVRQRKTEKAPTVSHTSDTVNTTTSIVQIFREKVKPNLRW